MPASRRCLNLIVACNAIWQTGAIRCSRLQAPTLKCSATSQDSKAENSNEVATPQKMRPTNRTLKLLKCLVKQPNT